MSPRRESRMTDSHGSRLLPTRRSRERLLGGYIFLWVYSLLALLPLMFLLINSVRPSAAIFAEPLQLPTTVFAENYRKAWVEGGFSLYFANSLIVTIGAVAVAITVSLLAAYPLARWRLRGSGAVSTFFLAGLLLPAQLGIVPLFYLLQTLRLFDSLIGLILVYAATGIPFGIFIMTTFLRQIPVELEEAAEIDGAGPVRTFFTIMVPLVRPAISTLIIFQFVPLWNDYFYPLILLRTEANYTLSVGLSRFFGQYQVDWGAVLAGLVIVTVPIVLMFIVATRRVVSALTAGIGK